MREETLLEKADRLVRNDPPAMVNPAEFRRIISALLIQFGIQKREIDNLRRRHTYDNSRT